MRLIPHWMISCILILSLLGGGPLAHATQTDNYGIHAVPAPGAVTLDGQLDDWDLSGQVLMCYDLESLRDIYSAQVAAMYDADNFYLALHWKDPAPMGNSHDPRYQASKGWAGDSVQLRFKTDRIAHVTAWYYAAKQEPTLQISYGTSLTEPFGGGDIQLFRTQGWNLEQGTAMAFRQDADGRGYVQEIKLPWKLLTNGKPYRAGDGFNMGMELLWGEADWPVHRYADNLQPGTTSREFFWTAHNAWGPVFLEPKGHLHLPEPPYMAAYRQATTGTTQGPVAISYQLPKAARVSLAIDDVKGQRIRNLVPALPRPAGKYTEHWDGLDDAGKPVPPGHYTFKAIYHDGIHANYVMSFANPGHPTWQTPDGRGAFYGDHTAPHTAAAGGNYVALACPLGEGGQPLIGLDLSGQRLWGLANRIAFGAGIIALATDGKTLWVGAEGNPPTIYRVDIATGKYAPWHKTAKDESGAEYQVLDLPLGPPVPTSTQTPPTPNLTALALYNGTLAVCLATDNLVRLLDSETGEVQREFKLEAPHAVTFAADGSLIVLAQGHLWRLTHAGDTTPFNHETYAAGYGLASDSLGNIYLSVRGAEQNVKVFTAQGQLSRVIGKPGGRPEVGAYDASGMRNPAGLAIDSQSRLWVTEETTNPKRTSVWDSQTGRLLKDLPGTASYAGAGALNPFEPSMAFSDNTVYQINLATGDWRPVYSVGRRDDPNDIFPLRLDSHVRVLPHAGNTYVFTSDRTGGVRCAMLHDGQWHAASFVGTVRATNDNEVNTNFQHPYLKEHVGEIVAWSDRNGDGLVQPDELTFARLTLDGKQITLTNTYWGHLPDTMGAIPYMVAGRNDVLVKIAMSGYAPSGAPLYNIDQPQVVRLNQPIINAGEGSIMGGKDGRIYLNQDPLTAVDANGQVLFTYPSHHVSVHGSHTAKASRPGYLIGPSMVLGTADLGRAIGEVFYLNGNLGENNLFTFDGLYIQTLFKDTRGYFDTPSQAVRGRSFDATTAGGESFGGNFVQTPDGKTYVTLGGTDAHVLEVTGLNTIHRFNGNFNYTPAQYAEAQHLMQEKIAQAAVPKVYTIARAATPATIDGKPDEWPELLDDAKPLLEIQENPQQRYGRVQMRYDATNLYLAYRVFAPRNTPQNAGQDWHLLFKTGDAVDLMLGPLQSPTGAGNLRLLMTTIGGQPGAVLNQKVVPGAPANTKYVFAAPWHTLTFDRVVQARAVKLATSPINGGYFVEAAIPWQELGIQPQPGLKLKGDVGVLFADTGGTTTIARQYWSNQATGLVNDVPGEADLTPNLWGTFVLE